MKKFIHHQNWNYLTGEKIVALFDEQFGDVDIQPNIDIVEQLRAMESATLECLEDRTCSTVYRIKQTGVVYQLCQPCGKLFEFDDYESYLDEEPIDELVRLFVTKEPVHIAYKEGGKLIIERKQPPRFKGYATGNNMNGIEVTEWIDPLPTNVMAIAKLMRKAGAFLNSYFKNSK